MCHVWFVMCNANIINAINNIGPVLKNKDNESY